MNSMANIFKYRILILALGVSLLWHLFWLSAVKIVSAPKQHAPVKFSKVSFLGPFLERGAINLRVQPKERAFLEKRYTDLSSGIVGDDTSGEDISARKYEPGVNADSLTERGLVALIDEALSGAKEEPGYIE